MANSIGSGRGALWDFVNHKHISNDVPLRKDILYEELEDSYLKLTVYNLGVEDFHTYYVGQHGVWVHNQVGSKRVVPMAASLSSMNSMAYADIDVSDTAMASTLASTLQQMSMSFGLACGSLVTGFYLAGLPQTNALAVTGAIHHAFLTLGALTLLSSLTFWTLRPNDGDSVSRGKP